LKASKNRDAEISYCLIETEVSVLLFSLTTTFVKEFFFDLWMVSPVLLGLAAVITVLGQVVAKKEGWRPLDGLYWSFNTATTVGYGDFHPAKGTCKVLALVIALVGLTFTGIFVAVGVHSESVALAAHDAAMKAM
jgi:hypothetical protein